MMQTGSLLWLLCALGAAILWGIAYAVSGRLMESGLSPAFLLTVQYFISVPFYLTILGRSNSPLKEIAALKQDWELLGLMALQILTIMLANFLIMNSIALKNATIASLIEISYPLFTLFFAYLLFGEVHLTISSAAGGLLIFAGIGLIYLKT